MNLIHIAIDGPAGAGKSTIAKNIANRLDILHLDTGAMYRAIGLYALMNNIDANNESALEKALDDIKITVKYLNKKQQTILNDVDVSSHIRTPAVSNAASTVSKWPFVRKKLVEIQRNISNEISIVMDGRDIGTYVLPNANYKFYLTASVDQRAKRRYMELKSNKKEVLFEDIKNEIEARDHQDMNREFAPLVKASDAIEIDTTELSIKQVTDIVFERLNIKDENN